MTRKEMHDQDLIVIVIDEKDSCQMTARRLKRSKLRPPVDCGMFFFHSSRFSSIEYDRDDYLMKSYFSFNRFSTMSSVVIDSRRVTVSTYN